MLVGKFRTAYGSQYFFCKLPALKTGFRGESQWNTQVEAAFLQALICILGNAVQLYFRVQVLKAGNPGH